MKNVVMCGSLHSALQHSPRSVSWTFPFRIPIIIPLLTVNGSRSGTQVEKSVDFWSARIKIFQRRYMQRGKSLLKDVAHEDYCLIVYHQRIQFADRQCRSLWICSGTSKTNDNWDTGFVNRSGENLMENYCYCCRGNPHPSSRYILLLFIVLVGSSDALGGLHGSRRIEQETKSRRVLHEPLFPIVQPAAPVPARLLISQRI